LLVVVIPQVAFEAITARLGDHVDLAAGIAPELNAVGFVST
jgi:hypothetical protein